MKRNAFSRGTNRQMANIGPEFGDAPTTRISKTFTPKKINRLDAGNENPFVAEFGQRRIGMLITKAELARRAEIEMRHSRENDIGDAPARLPSCFTRDVE